MLFHSPGFLLVFLPLFLAAMVLLPAGTTRAVTLLGFSYLFYSAGEPLFVLLLVISSTTDFFVALKLSVTEDLRFRRIWLLVSLVVNLGLLGFFKYGGWVLPHFAPALATIGIPTLSEDFFRGFVLPAGISFYTFQSLAYTIDVYRRDVEPERSLLSFCNYVAYLPQLIAGPIERFNQLGPQLHRFIDGRTRPQWSAGLDRILLGVFQKLVLADGCGHLVDRMLVYPGAFDLFAAWSIAVGFGLQIYFDFAAYTHMAIGVSLLLGVRLQENFLAPYQADSIREFWRRWHVTLSRWFRDYLYIPLGGSRVAGVRTVFNLLVTFLLCGLWHGAGLNFLFWGLMHGLYLGIFHTKQRIIPNWSLPHPLAVLLTFAAVSFAWVPFRVDDMFTVVKIWSGMVGVYGVGESVVSTTDILIVGILTLLTMIVPHAGSRWPGASGWKESLAIAGLAGFAILSSPSVTRFIYFQF